MNETNELENESRLSPKFYLAAGLDFKAKISKLVGDEIREVGTFVMRTFRPDDEESCVGVDITFSGVKGSLGGEVNDDEDEEIKSRVTIPGNELELQSGRRWFANREEFGRRRELNKESKLRELSSHEQAELDRLNQVIHAEEFLLAGAIGILTVTATITAKIVEGGKIK